MTSLPGKAEEIGDVPLPLADLLTDLSVLLAMQYRRAPLPIAPGLVRWFATRPQAQVVNELGSVMRRCILLGDETLVLQELQRQRFVTHMAPAHHSRVTETRCRRCVDAGALSKQGAGKKELPSRQQAEPSGWLSTTQLLPPVEASNSPTPSGSEWINASAVNPAPNR